MRERLRRRTHLVRMRASAMNRIFGLQTQWGLRISLRRLRAQSGDCSRTGALSKAGSRTLRWAAVEAAQHAWRPSNPWHQLYSDLAQRAGKNPAKAAVARKILIPPGTSCPANNRSSPPPRAGPTLSRQAPVGFCPPDGPTWN